MVAGMVISSFATIQYPQCYGFRFMSGSDLTSHVSELRKSYGTTDILLLKYAEICPQIPRLAKVVEEC
jgi:hypothetical protein